MKRRRGFAKTAPKSLEKRIIDNAIKIEKDISIIFPKPLDEKSKRVVEKLEKKLIKVWRRKNDIKFLEKYSMKKGLDGALAGILILANKKSAPYLAQAIIGGKKILFAMRGKADKEKLISLQYIDDAVLRLLGYRDIAFKKGLAIYSWNNSFVCSSKESDVPEPFINFLSNLLNLSRKQESLSCRDINTREYFYIKFKNLDIRLCRNCVKDRNTLMEITKYFIHPELGKEIKVDIKSTLTKYGVKLRYTRDYLEGKINDKDFFSKNLMSWKEDMKGEKIIYVDGKVYQNIEDIKKDKGMKESEEKAIKILFSKIKEPLFLEKFSVNDVLEKHWRTLGREILQEIFNDKDLVENIFNLEEPPVKQIERLEEAIKRKEIIREYPEVNKNSKWANFVDRLFREYTVYGKNKVTTTLSQPPDDPRLRGLAFAFLICMGEDRKKKWQYTQEEIELGNFLKNYVEEFLKSEPKNYISNLRKILSLAGLS